MRTNRRSEIAVEPRRRVIVRRRHRKVVSLWCPACRANQHMVNIKYAAFLSGLSLRQIFSFVEGGRLHLVVAPDGSYVCLESLSALAGASRGIGL